MTTIDYARVIKNSVQEPPDARKEALSSFWYEVYERGFNLPAWGTRKREQALRSFYHHEYNWLGQSAFAGLTKKWSATPWEIVGKQRVRYFQDVLRDAQFGAGWDVFLQQVGLDFLRQDGGAYIELIAPGNPLKAPTGPVVGIAHLDSLRCLPTGDPQYPVIYYSRKGKMHLMHHTRVVHLVDAPDGDETHPGYGLSAQSRAMALVAQQIHMNRYIEAKLDDKPPPGYMIASNINEGLRNTAFERYRQEQMTDEKPFWGRTLWLYSVNPAAPAKLETVTFSQAPETFNYKEYTELHVNAWALALGIDVQELWQLTGGSLGSGQQSQILHAKSQGKTYGAFLTRLERAMNDVLPESLTFEFKVRDPYEAQERAQTAQLWGGFVTAVGSAMSDDEKRALLANQVEAFKDAVTDEHGEIQRLTDVDPQPETDEQTVDDATPQDADAETTTTPEQTADSAKAIQATQLEFESDFADLLAGARSGDIERRRFGIILRDLLRRYGRDAYRDGLKDGGVEGGAMDSSDDADYVTLLARQSAYVTGLGDEVYGGVGISDAQASLKPEQWYRGSVAPFYDAGRLSADRNGMYEFVGDDGLENCSDCKRLKGQVHRFRDWIRRKLNPPYGENLECAAGKQCKHSLTRVSARAVGSF